MEKLSQPPHTLGPIKLSNVLMLAAVFSVAMIGTAQADNNHNNGKHYGKNNNWRHYNNSREWRDHSNYNRRYWNKRYYKPEPTVVYAPPAYYYPEPVYQSPGLNFVFPLHIR